MLDHSVNALRLETSRYTEGRPLVSSLSRDVSSDGLMASPGDTPPSLEADFAALRKLRDDDASAVLKSFFGDGVGRYEIADGPPEHRSATSLDADGLRDSEGQAENKK